MKNFMRGWRSRGFLLNRLGFNFAWDLIQEGVGYPNRNKAWKGVPVQVLFRVYQMPYKLNGNCVTVVAAEGYGDQLPMSGFS